MPGTAQVTYLLPLSSRGTFPSRLHCRSPNTLVPNCGHINITWRIWQNYKDLDAIVLQGPQPGRLRSFPGDSDTHLHLRSSVLRQWSSHVSRIACGAFNAGHAGAQVILIQDLTVGCISPAAHLWSWEGSRPIASLES